MLIQRLLIVIIRNNKISSIHKTIQSSPAKIYNLFKPMNFFISAKMKYIKYLKAFLVTLFIAFSIFILSNSIPLR